MIKKILLLVIIIFIAVFSCTKKGKTIEITVKLCSFEAALLDNTFELPQVASKDTISAKVFGIRLSMKYVDEVSVCKINPWETFSLFPSCYAVGPVRTTYIHVPLNEIDSVVIFSDNDFDAVHPAGSNLSEYFSVFKSSSYEKAQKYLSGGRRISFQDEYLKTEVIDLLLMGAPENEGEHQFTIRLLTNQGEVLEETTSSIYLKL